MLKFPKVLDSSINMDTARATATILITLIGDNLIQKISCQSIRKDREIEGEDDQ